MPLPLLLVPAIAGAITLAAPAASTLSAAAITWISSICCAVVSSGVTALGMWLGDKYGDKQKLTTGELEQRNILRDILKRIQNAVKNVVNEMIEEIRDNIQTLLDQTNAKELIHNTLNLQLEKTVSTIEDETTQLIQITPLLKTAAEDVVNNMQPATDALHDSRNVLMDVTNTLESTQATLSEQIVPLSTTTTNLITNAKQITDTFSTVNQRLQKNPEPPLMIATLEAEVKTLKMKNRDLLSKNQDLIKTVAELHKELMMEISPPTPNRYSPSMFSR